MSAAKHLTGDLKQAKRIVIKIGSALLVDESKGVLRRRWLQALAEDIATLRKEGREVIVVSSGSIAVGRRYLSLGQRPLRLEEKQAAAAAGMIRLAHAYQDALGHHGITVAQVLLTLDDTESRRRYINARNTLDTLLSLGSVPLINENDTVATDEIRFGDNDRLAARVAAMVSADTLVLLSDIDGLYTADPNRDPDARFLPEVLEISAEIEAMAGDPVTAHGSGGMVTKLAAAKICLGAGCRMAITQGHEEHPLKRLAEGARATWFLPKANPAKARKQWIAGSLKAVGTLWLDDGALTALNKGKSLLPAGVTKVEGKFGRGAAVVVRAADGHEVARGLMAYPSADARKIAGHKTSDIESLIGYRGSDEMIHRDDLVLL
ncbi:glutamate 5-kinase [Magnetospira sp. QH-2]|uniref:glutamate 5-kinase n=1 Tax=Magnetospira sp. (strain QH-2) TaxID=1288970 RepID=UPI0003E819E1|nr:glutamate 5-kinase [Magnetospira sp. QH-2]CCQ72533.1 gamma-glutamate kinase [Magnetospira sp. QH-2]